MLVLSAAAVALALTLVCPGFGVCVCVCMCELFSFISLWQLSLRSSAASVPVRVRVYVCVRPRASEMENVYCARDVFLYVSSLFIHILTLRPVPVRPSAITQCPAAVRRKMPSSVRSVRTLRGGREREGEQRTVTGSQAENADFLLPHSFPSTYSPARTHTHTCSHSHISMPIRTSPETSMYASTLYSPVSPSKYMA